MACVGEMKAIQVTSNGPPQRVKVPWVAVVSPSSSIVPMSSSAFSRVGLFEIAALMRVADPIQS